MKKILIYVTCILLLFGMTGCTEKNETNTPSDNTEIITDTNKDEVLDESGNEEKEESKDSTELNTQTNQNKPQNEQTNTQTNKDESVSNKVENEKTEEKVETPVKTCTPKKFNNKYSYAYKTEQECKKEGNLKFLELSDTVLPNIFLYDCETIVDECGETYYGVVFYDYDHENSIERKIYY